MARPVPYVPQMESSECGAACVTMILAWYGCHAPLAEVREACNVSRDGTSALDLVKGCEQYAVDTDSYVVEVGDLHEVDTPAILHWELNHFVVLDTMERWGARIVDPVAGSRDVSRDELRRAFTGVVLVPSPRADFAQRKKRRR